ncbi:hypothetical protein [Nocardia seriolae]|nr:hypothetical protein [Nocardia seriolae]OJF79536.1 hypothetical protein NS14008_10425 [Nocardia seriolae]WKY56608.1 hypothetical protein Q5P07_12540 [Nocardia seriolae]WNJ63289.1 hypothetical protein RMO66_26710 [Nocardia seriolae]
MANKGTSLVNGQYLRGDDLLVSNNGKFSCYMQDDGNLVLLHGQDLARPYWSVASDAIANYVGQRAQAGPYYAEMQTDGNLVLYNGSDPAHRGGPYWATKTSQAAARFTLDMQDDGNLVLYRLGAAEAKTPLWDSKTWWAGLQVGSGAQVLNTNQWIGTDTYLISRDGRYAVYLQGDGNLVVFPTHPTSPAIPDLARPLWSIASDPTDQYVGTATPGGRYYAQMQDDGNFVLYNGSDPGHRGTPYWASGTARNQKGEFSFGIENTGGLMVCQGSGALSDSAVIRRVYPYRSWMGSLGAHFANRPLHQLVIPGTHDSGTYGLDPGKGFSRDSSAFGDFLDPTGNTTLAWGRSQDRDILTQLRSGIRFLDLRVENRPHPHPIQPHGGPHPDDRPWQHRIHIVHSLYGPNVAEVLVPVEQFLSNHRKEVVVLYFSTNVNRSMDPPAWQGFADYVTALFGNRLAPASLGTAVTLDILWSRGHQVVVIWEDPATATTHGFWPKDAVLDKFWYSNDDPSLAGLKSNLETSLRAKSNTKLSLTACAIGATTKLIEAGQFPNIDSSQLGHPKSLHEVAVQVTPAAMHWVQTDWNKLPLNIVTSDFYQIGNEVDLAITRNILT